MQVYKILNFSKKLLRNAFPNRFINGEVKFGGTIKGKFFPTNKKYILEEPIMINTQYEGLIAHTSAEKTGSVKLVEKEEAVNNETTKAAVLPNVDRFEHSMAETTAVYSPETLGKGSTSVNAAASTTSQATTDYQRENIFKFLAAKIAGLRTDSYGTPYINRQSEVDAYAAAQRTIRGNHPKLSYKKEYCYSQQGYSYGNPDPKNSCDTFAFATALSIKYGKSITPDKIVIGTKGGYVMDHWDSDSDTVLEWNYNDNGKIKTAYRISASRGNDTLVGIDTQLQLGNPVLIHTSGKSVQTGQESEHWATVIGKENGRYRIIDPWDGSERWLEDMEIYKNGGSILDYTILTDEY